MVAETGRGEVGPRHIQNLLHLLHSECRRDAFVIVDAWTDDRVTEIGCGVPATMQLAQEVSEADGAILDGGASRRAGNLSQAVAVAQPPLDLLKSFHRDAPVARLARPLRGCPTDTVPGRTAAFGGSDEGSHPGNRWSPTREIGWARTQEIRWSPTEEIGWYPSEEIAQAAALPSES